jgi:hypothetical protein
MVYCVTGLVKMKYKQEIYLCLLKISIYLLVKNETS